MTFTIKSFEYAAAGHIAWTYDKSGAAFRDKCAVYR